MSQISATPSRSLNADVTDYLDYYCGLVHPPYHAVMLNGQWGCGKTKLIQTYIESWDNAKLHRNFVFVSLYGIATAEQIDDAIFRKMHPLLGSKGFEIAGRIATSMLKFGLKIDLNDSEALEVKAEVPAFKLKQTEIKDTILIFDDVERCSLKPSELFGYINHFVEHDGLKVILIANEEHIDASDASYGRIKEKLIGRTLEVRAEFDQAFSSFLKEMECSFAAAYVKDNVEIVRKTYQQSGIQNLRIVRQSMNDFERVYVRIGEKYRHCTSLMLRFMRLFFITSFELKAGRIKDSNVTKLFGFDFSSCTPANATKEPSAQSTVEKRYVDAGITTPLLSGTTWDDLIRAGRIEVDDLHRQFEQTGLVDGVNQDDWRTLWSLSSLSSEQFEKASYAVIRDFDGRAFKDQGHLLHVVGLLITLAKGGAIDRTPMDIVAEAKIYIDFMFSDMLMRPRPYSRGNSLFDSYDGLGYAASKTDEFKEVCDYLTLTHNRNYQLKLPSFAEEMIAGMENDPDRFFGDMCGANDDTREFCDIPIFALSEPSRFINAFMGATASGQNIICQAISARYNSGFAALHDELPWLTQVRDGILKAAGERHRFEKFRIKRDVEHFVYPILDGLSEVETVDESLDAAPFEGDS